MKTMILLMSAILYTGGLWAQQLLVKTAPGDTTTVRYCLPFSTLQMETDMQPLISREGKASVHLNITSPRFGYLTYGNKTYEWYAEPGRNTVVSFPDTSGQPRFEGPLANENALLNSAAFKTYGHPLYDSLKTTPALSPAALQANLAQLRAEKLYAFAQVAKKQSLSKDFVYLFGEELVYYYENICYDFFDHWYNGENARDTAMRRQWFTALEEVFSTAPVSNEKALVLPEYKIFLNGYFRYGYNTKGRDIPYVEKLMGKSKAEIMAEVQKAGSELPVTMALSRDFFKGKTGAYFAATQVISYTQKGSLNLKAALNGQLLYDSLHPASPYRQEVATALQPIKDFQASPQKSSGLTYLENTTYPTLEKVLEKFKGKVVYLDAWATWCGYCQLEFSWLPELKQRFGNDLVYLYVSIDEDQKQTEWENMAGFFKLDGNHYRVGGSGENYNRLLQVFGKKEGDRFGIPAYAIINRQGEVVVNNAFRPGDKERLYQQLEKYLLP